jgi:monoamine oxidase
MTKNESIVIVGAGLSGLYTAALLTAQGIPCILLEARERIGGRVLSSEVLDRPDLGRFDLGPTWFWPRYDRTITKFGLKIFEQFHEGFILFERSRNEHAQQYVLPEGAVEKSFRFIGGVQSLIKAIAATLPPATVQNITNE